MTKKQLHKYILKQISFICRQENIPVPILKRDNRIMYGGQWIFGKNLIIYNSKLSYTPLNTILHELGHCFYQHKGNYHNTSPDEIIIKEYLAESFCCYCIISYFPNKIDKYKTFLKTRLPYFHKYWKNHYVAFKRVYEENFTD